MRQLCARPQGAEQEVCCTSVILVTSMMSPITKALGNNSVRLFGTSCPQHVLWTSELCRC